MLFLVAAAIPRDWRLSAFTTFRYCLKDFFEGLLTVAFPYLYRTSDGGVGGSKFRSV